MSLAQGWFGAADAVSIEMWLTVDSATQDNAILFLFGDKSTPDACVDFGARSRQGVVNTYVVVVIDPHSQRQMVYINGVVFTTLNF